MGKAAPVGKGGDMGLIVTEGEASEAERWLELIEGLGGEGIRAGEEVGCGGGFGVEEGQGIAVFT